MEREPKPDTRELLDDAEEFAQCFEAEGDYDGAAFIRRMASVIREVALPCTVQQIR